MNPSRCRFATQVVGNSSLSCLGAFGDQGTFDQWRSRLLEKCIQLSEISDEPECGMWHVGCGMREVCTARAKQADVELTGDDLGDDEEQCRSGYSRCRDKASN